MPEHALPDVDFDGDGVVDDVDATDPIELVETDDSLAAEPPADWDSEAHSEETANDPAVVLTDDDTPEAA